MFIQGTMINLLRQGILFLLLYLVFKNDLKLGQLMTLQFYSFFIFNPLQEMGSLIIAYREAQASLKNFASILANPIEKSPEAPQTVGIVERLSFQEVAFQHKTVEYKALNKISFDVKKGETIAFVGPSGAGKSTLVKLLVGLYDAHEGTISYNGIPSIHVEKEELRHQIGFVTQDTQLFAGTIKENMLFVKPDASDEQIVEVLRKAACHTLLERSDSGIYSVIGEGGMKVSGGEKQRLSIARAILRNPNLFVFDEATSALDSMTEDEISNTIRRISAEGNHITVMIAHRLSTIMHADRIYVLEKGEIVEMGTHEALLIDKGLYYAMWRQQIGERK
jgi:ATP-binding cassette subfamily B protein